MSRVGILSEAGRDSDSEGDSKRKGVESESEGGYSE